MSSKIVSAEHNSNNNSSVKFFTNKNKKAEKQKWQEKANKKLKS